MDVRELVRVTQEYYKTGEQVWLDSMRDCEEEMKIDFYQSDFIEDIAKAGLWLGWSEAKTFALIEEGLSE
jgi:hypothetical protein